MVTRTVVPCAPGSDAGRTAQCRNSLAHIAQADAAGKVGCIDVEALAIVDDGQAQRQGTLFRDDPHRSSAGMALDVSQAFLGDAKECGCDGRRPLPTAALVADRDRQARPVGKLAAQVVECSQQTGSSRIAGRKSCEMRRTSPRVSLSRAIPRSSRSNVRIRSRSAPEAVEADSMKNFTTPASVSRRRAAPAPGRAFLLL